MTAVPRRGGLKPDPTPTDDVILNHSTKLSSRTANTVILNGVKNLRAFPVRMLTSRENFRFFVTLRMTVLRRGGTTGITPNSQPVKDTPHLSANPPKVDDTLPKQT